MEQMFIPGSIYSWNKHFYKKTHKLYKSTVQAISKVGGDFSTKVGSLCDCFVDIGDPVKIQVKNGLNKLFNFQGQTIDVSDQAVFTFKDSGLHDEEGKKTKVSDPITSAQRRLGSFCISGRLTHTRLIKTTSTVA